MGDSMDLLGKRFTRITVIGKIDNTHWLCECDCGNTFIATSSHLIHHYKKSCGCLRKEVSKYNTSFQRKNNTYDLSGEYGIGYTSNTNEAFFFDLEDYDKIKDYTWYKGDRYIKARGKCKKEILLHKLITETDKNTIVDHVDRNPLNCRKYNLRICSQSDNCCNINLRKNNSSGVTGVRWSNQKNKWLAYIQKNKKNKSLGSFDYFEDAVRARLLAEKELFGEYSPQKHLYEQYGISEVS